VSSRGIAEVGEDGVVDLFAGGVGVLAGVVALGGEGVAEFDGGGEERAGLADRLVSIAEGLVPGAVAVSQEPGAGLLAEGALVGAFGVGGQWRWGVDGLDPAGDVEVFVDDGPVCDLFWRSQILEVSEYLSGMIVVCGFGDGLVVAAAAVVGGVVGPVSGGGAWPGDGDGDGDVDSE
jgi:hypothetical protein